MNPLACGTNTGRKKANPEGLAFFLVSAGAGKRSRTPDLRITNALLYQLSYAGEERGLYNRARDRFNHYAAPP